MKRARHVGSWVATMVGGCLLSGGAFGAGFQLYNEGSAEALGLGGAVSARRDLLSNTWYNPAALAGSEKKGLTLGLTFVAPSYTYDAGGPGGEQKLEQDLHGLPHLNYVHPLSEKWTAMLAMNVPYGLGTEWDKAYLRSLYNPGNRLDFLTAPVLGLPQQINLMAPYITPSLGYRFDEKLSVAAGVSLVYAEFFLQNILHPAAAAVYGTDEVEYEGEGYGLGWLLATHYQFNPEWAAGLTFHSPVSLKLQGETDMPGLRALALDDLTGDLRLPPSLVLGLANQSFERWTLTADVVWTGWSSYDKLQIVNQDTGAVILDSPKDWDNVLGYRAGAEYQASEHWVLRGGYVYDQSPVPTRTRGLELPCNDRHMFSVGAGYTCGNWGVDVSYCYLLLKNGDAGAPMARIGDFSDAYAHMLGISFHTEF